MTFDKTAGCCWSGPRRGADGNDNSIAIDRIECLQVVCKYISGESGGFHNHELLLVLNDPPGRRVRVMGHGKPYLFWEDAWALAEFLEKPVWDCSDA